MTGANMEKISAGGGSRIGKAGVDLIWYMTMAHVTLLLPVLL